MGRFRPPLVDAHIHLWDLERLNYAWLTPPFTGDGPNGDVEPVARTYLLADYLTDAAGWLIEGAVHVDAGAAAHQALAETSFVEEIAASAPFALVHVAYAALHEPGMERLLAAHAASPVVRGVRQILNWHPDPRKTYTPADLLGTPEFARGFARLARYGLSFDLQIYPGQMQAAARLAAENGDTTLILNHAGMPTDRDPEGLQWWRQGMRALAAQPNVFVKLSGFGIVDPDWTTESIRPFVHETIDLFGPARVMVASDVPTDKLHATFDRLLNAYDVLTADLDGQARQALFNGNARRVYRLGGACPRAARSHDVEARTSG